MKIPIPVAALCLALWAAAPWAQARQAGTTPPPEPQARPQADASPRPVARDATTTGQEADAQAVAGPASQADQDAEPPEEEGPIEPEEEDDGRS